MCMIQEARYLLEIVSDTICPWCYIGKKRLDAALGLIGDEIAFDVRWRPFELNPDIPPEGLDRKAYRSAKFGSWNRSLALDAQVAAAGAQAGLAIHHERMTRTPNTLASHVLERIAGEAGRQDEVVEAVFKAYFTDGRDVGDIAVLSDLGVACGLERAKVEAALTDEPLRTAVRADAHALAQSGITGVPTVMVNRFVVFSGARLPDVIAGALRHAAAHGQVAAAGHASSAHG